MDNEQPFNWTIFSLVLFFVWNATISVQVAISCVTLILKPLWCSFRFELHKPIRYLPASRLWFDFRQLVTQMDRMFRQNLNCQLYNCPEIKVNFFYNSKYSQKIAFVIAYRRKRTDWWIWYIRFFRYFFIHILFHHFTSWITSDIHFHKAAIREFSFISHFDLRPNQINVIDFRK